VVRLVKYVKISVDENLIREVEKIINSVFLWRTKSEFIHEAIRDKILVIRDLWRVNNGEK